MVLYNKQEQKVEEQVQAEHIEEQQVQVEQVEEQQAQVEQPEQQQPQNERERVHQARRNYADDIMDNFYFPVERRESGFVSYDYLAKKENIHENDHINPGVGYVECQECGHSSGCNGKVRYYEFDWHVRPRARDGGCYWTKIVFPYCIKHINMVLQEYSYDPTLKVWTSGRDNWSALDALYLPERRD